jgi:hypothetical protein
MSLLQDKHFHNKKRLQKKKKKKIQKFNCCNKEEICANSIPNGHPFTPK